MSEKKIVVALGGNALGNTPEEQLQLVKQTAKTIADLTETGAHIIVGHGNGPQVGTINLAFETASVENSSVCSMPFPECGAMSQGYIGYHLQQSIQNEFKKRGINRPVVSLVTQMLVDENDPAFSNLSKPIGSFYTKEEAEAIQKEKGYTFVEDAGRGYRRVVASPLPKKIVELEEVKLLSDSGAVVVTVGGGGIPVVEKNGELNGVPAVIDKDRSSARLAADLGADMLLILTAVDQVMINFNKPNQQGLADLTIEEAEKHIADGQFAKGSMLPKVEACLGFLREGKEGASALITSLERAGEALEGKTGTKIHN